MGKPLLSWVLACGVLLVAATSRSDVTAPTPASDAVAEPITGTAVTPAAGFETPPRDPFSPYDTGPPGAKPWRYQDLNAAEKAVADKNKNAAGWDRINNAFAQASAARAHRATADSAQAQLGVDNLDITGVIP